MIETIFEATYRSIVQFKNSVKTISKLSNHLWVVAADNKEPTKLVFKKGGELIVSEKGVVSHGTYELLPEADSIIITFNGESHMYNHIYADEGILFLRLDTVESKPFVLVNNNLLENKSAIEYLRKKYVEPQETKQIHVENDLIYWSEIWQGREHIRLFKSRNSLKVFAFYRGTYLQEGKYILKGKDRTFLIIGPLGEVKEYYKEKTVNISHGETISIQCDPIKGLIAGCKVLKGDSPAPDGKYKISWLKSITVANGVISDDR